jgi:hypothetical protein
MQLNFPNHRVLSKFSFNNSILKIRTTSQLLELNLLLQTKELESHLMIRKDFLPLISRVQIKPT